MSRRTTQQPRIFGAMNDVRETLLAGQRKPSFISRWFIDIRVFWCLVAHAVVILFYGGTTYLEFNNVKLPYGVPSRMLQTAITLALTILVTVYTTVLLGFTQGLALRKNFGDIQTLTALHDRTECWLGLWSTLMVVFKHGRNSGRVYLTLVYLFLLFALHNVMPALITVTLNHRVPGKGATINIVEMTPSTATSSWALHVPYDELASTRNGLMPGVSGPAIYDTIANSSLTFFSWTNLSSILCMTTFQPTCDVVPVLNFANDPVAQQWNATLGDGWTAHIDYAVAIPQQSGGTVPQLRIIPVPTGNTTGPLVPYVTLLALWNVTDRNGSVDNSVHFNFNTSMSVDMTFLECTLSWSVTAVTITNNDTAPETLNPHYCERRDNGQYDANMYPWDSVWTQALSWPSKEDTGSVLHSSSRATEEYLMTEFGSVFSGVTPDTSNFPRLDDIGLGLANMTSVLIWLASQMNIGDAWPHYYTARGSFGVGFVDIVDIYLASIPWIAGIVISVLLTLIVYALLRGRDRTLHAVEHDGVLELAWLFAHQPNELQKLKEMNKFDINKVRDAGKDIVWDAQRATSNAPDF